MTNDHPIQSPPIARDGVIIRPIEPGDAAELERFYARLGEDSRRLRFFSITGGLNQAQSATFCTTDHEHREGFVAVAPGPGGWPRIVGHCCLEPIAAGRAEVALAVADELQGRGIGRRLMIAAFDWARWAGVTTLVATMLAANPGIHRLMASLGVPVHVRPIAADVTMAELVVPPGRALAA